ncbi:MAG: RnfABCDGE type electron transport complex subunit G [Limnochordia bacterium]|nr:RnfABCDGE type electron transport complex subunit G [Limnochordia bacterium]
MSSGAKMILALIIVSVGAGVVLAVVYNYANPKIEEHAALRLADSIGAVLPEASSFTKLESADVSFDPSSFADEIYLGHDGQGEPVGLAFVVTGPGFQGGIKVLIGMELPGCTIGGVRVLEHVETPGLGARIEEDWFTEQFIGKDASGKLDKEIDTITGATISSKAVTNIVNDYVYKIAQELIPQLGVLERGSR